MKHLNTILLFTFLLFSSITLEAAVFTWIGGTGDWNDNNNWDLGDVPGYQDAAIIPSGTVTINDYANVNYIHLDGGNLINNDVLFVEPDIPWAGYSSNGVNGIHIESGSSFENFGKTIISQDGNINTSSQLIFCNGGLINHNSGLLFLQGDESTGIHSYVSSNVIVNNGDIEMSFIKSGLYLLRPFQNYGSISIQCENVSVTNRESFFSAVGATLKTNGRIVANSNSTWIENGKIEVNYNTTSNANVISLDGSMDIKPSGSLKISGSHSSFSIGTSGVFRVRGDLDIVNTKQFSFAFINNGFMVNHQKGNINTEGYYGVVNGANGQMLNYGIWHMNEVNFRSLLNYGSFSNRPKGKLYVYDRLELLPGSTFNNQVF